MHNNFKIFNMKTNNLEFTTERIKSVKIIFYAYTNFSPQGFIHAKRFSSTWLF